MSILADGVRVADADNPRGYYEFQQAKRLAEDSSWVRDARGKVVKVIYMLLQNLPADQNYAVVFMERDLDEVVASQSRMLDRLGQPRGDLPGAAFVEAFRDQLRDVREWLAEQSNMRVEYVEFSSAVEDPTATAAKVNEFLGCALDAKKMAAVVDPSLYRQKC